MTAALRRRTDRPTRQKNVHIPELSPSRKRHRINCDRTNSDTHSPTSKNSIPQQKNTRASPIWIHYNADGKKKTQHRCDLVTLSSKNETRQQQGNLHPQQVRRSTDNSNGENLANYQLRCAKRFQNACKRWRRESKFIFSAKKCACWKAATPSPKPVGFFCIFRKAAGDKRSQHRESLAGSGSSKKIVDAEQRPQQWSNPFVFF